MQHLKCCTKDLTVFKFDPTSSNMLQHIATGWPNVCNMLCPTMLQDVALKCCERLTRPLDSRSRTTTSTRFSHRTTVSGRKPASFWREKGDTVVILERDFAKMLSCQNNSTTRYHSWHFSISKKLQLPAIRTTEQPMLSTKSKINRPG